MGVEPCSGVHSHKPRACVGARRPVLLGAEQTRHPGHADNGCIEAAVTSGFMAGATENG